MAIFWASIPIGLVLVAASVGIPYFLIHRGMRPDNPAEAYAYLDARDDIARTEDPGDRRRAYLAARARQSDRA